MAAAYKKRGLELAIVKKWVLSSFLAETPAATTNYLLANELEIKNGTSFLQAQLMSDSQLAFSGTHDLVDHLLGGTGLAFSSRRTLYVEARDTIAEVLNKNPASHRALLLAYLVGIILDDMAQPTWYHSRKHEEMLCHTLKQFKSVSAFFLDWPSLVFPLEFHSLIQKLRDKSCVFIGENALT